MVVVDGDVCSLRRKRRVKLLFIFLGRTEDRHGGRGARPTPEKSEDWRGMLPIS